MELRELRLSATNITDKGLSCLALARNLEILDVSHTGITDIGLERIQHIPHLRRLNLSGTAITDAGISRTVKQETLELVDLRLTRISSAGAEAVRKALPKATILHGLPPKSMSFGATAPEWQVPLFGKGR
jgi:Leucine rich repeat